MMKTLPVLLLVLLTGCASPPTAPVVSILLDLDPASADRTTIIESITADRNGVLFTADRVTGNVLRIDPKAPKAVVVVVAKIEARDIQGKKVNPDPGGIAFNAAGDLFVTAGPFAEIVRFSGADLAAGKPALAQTFATGVPGANGIAFDRQGQLFVSGGASGVVYRVAPGGGAGQVAAQIERSTRTLPDGKAQQAIVANGIEFDAQGVLHVADTSRGAVWKVAMGADGIATKPVLLVQSALLEGADGLAFDRSGNLWIAANERNAIVSVSPSGEAKDVTQNDSKGPLEFPSALVFVGDTAYISNFDVPRRVNMDAGGSTARDGVGASIAKISR